MLSREELTPPNYAAKLCLLVKYRMPFLRHCFVLCHEPLQVETGNVRANLLEFFYSEAERLSFEHTGDPQNYIMIHSGLSVRSRANLHSHIFVVESRWQKAWVYTAIAAKNWVVAAHTVLRPAKVQSAVLSLWLSFWGSFLKRIRVGNVHTGQIINLFDNPNMHASFIRHIPNIALLCERYGVSHLELFGSATGPDFDPASSDFDFLVELDNQVEGSRARRWTGLADALESLLGRHVDLVNPRYVRNPYFLKAVNSSRTVIYDRQATQAAG